MKHCTILLYHTLVKPGDFIGSQYCTAPEDFRAHMRLLREGGYSPVPLSDLVAAMEGRGTLPENPVVVTFDDGYACNLEHGLPAMQEFDIPATIFMVAGRISGRNEWQILEGCPARRMLNPTELRTLSDAGIDIGSHTMLHCFLGGAEPATVRVEVGDSKARIEDIIGRPVRHFAYPYGSISDYAREAVQAAGYVAACSTIQGKNRLDTDRFRLRRIELRGYDTPWSFRQRLRFGVSPDSQGLRQLAKRTLTRVGMIKPSMESFS